MTINSATSAPTGNIRIGGFPFSGTRGSIHFGFISGAPNNTTGYLLAGTTQFALVRNGSTFLVPNDFNFSNCSLSASGQYFV
jgi:hypothetical protein